MERWEFTVTKREDGKYSVLTPDGETFIAEYSERSGRAFIVSRTSDKKGFYDEAMVLGMVTRVIENC